MPTNNSNRAPMSMNWILLNIPLAALMVAFTVGLPLWVMLKYPEGDDTAIAHTAPVTHEGSAAREYGVAGEYSAVAA